MGVRRWEGSGGSGAQMTGVGLMGERDPLLALRDGSDQCENAHIDRARNFGRPRAVAEPFHIAALWVGVGCTRVIGWGERKCMCLRRHERRVREVRAWRVTGRGLVARGLLNLAPARRMQAVARKACLQRGAVAGLGQ